MIMPDSRIRLRHEGPSLLNVPTPVFQGPAHSLYGPRGPQRAAPDYAARKPLSTQPETVEHYIEDSLARADLSARQRTAVESGGRAGRGPTAVDHHPRKWELHQVTRPWRPARRP